MDEEDFLQKISIDDTLGLNIIKVRDENNNPYLLKIMKDNEENRKEIFFLKTIDEEIKSSSKCFPKVIYWILISSAKILDEVKKLNILGVASIDNSEEYLYLVIEFADRSFETLNTRLTFYEVKSILFELFHALMILNKYHEIYIHDFSLDNLLLKKTSENRSYLDYDKKVCSRNIPKIIGFRNASAFENNDPLELYKVLIPFIKKKAFFTKRFFSEISSLKETLLSEDPFEVLNHPFFDDLNSSSKINEGLSTI